DMVDAQRAAAPAVLADRFGEQAVTIVPVPLGLRRRKAPVLTLRREVVRRRSDAATGDVEAPVTPEVRAEAVGRQRQVVIKPDGHAALACALLRAPQLHVYLPLHELIKQHAAPVGFPE